MNFATLRRRCHEQFELMAPERDRFRSGQNLFRFAISSLSISIVHQVPSRLSRKLIIAVQAIEQLTDFEQPWMKYASADDLRRLFGAR